MQTTQNTQPSESMTENEIEALKYVNLVEMVTASMAKLGHPRPNDWANGLDQMAYTCPDILYRRHFINRTLRLIIGAVETENTIDVRGCLFDDGHMHDWFRHLEDKVIPCMIRLNLPPAIN